MTSRGQIVGARAAGSIGHTKIFRQGKNFYYVTKRGNGKYFVVTVQSPLPHNATTSRNLNGVTQANASKQSSQQSLPANIATIATTIARGIVKGVLSGGAAIGKLAGNHFPLVPVLFGVVLAGLGVLLKMQRLRFRPRQSQSIG